MTIHFSHVQHAEAAFVDFCKEKKQAEGGSFYSLASLDQDRLLRWAAEFCRQKRYGGFMYRGGDLQFYDLDYDVLKAKAERDTSEYHAADKKQWADSTLFLVVPPGAAKMARGANSSSEAGSDSSSDEIDTTAPASAPARAAPTKPRRVSPWPGVLQRHIGPAERTRSRAVLVEEDRRRRVRAQAPEQQR